MHLVGSEDKYYGKCYYRGSDGEAVKLKFSSFHNAWFWRHLGGSWHGPFPDAAGVGKHHCLQDAAHTFGKSGSKMNFVPEDEIENFFK